MHVLYQQLCHCVVLLPECYELDNWEVVFFDSKLTVQKVASRSFRDFIQLIPLLPPK